MRRLGEIKVPRGAVAVLCALVCLPPAAMALAHTPWISGGQWVHHHTRYYDTCNYINQDTLLLRPQAQAALDDWDDNTAIEFDPQTYCHVSEGAPEQAHVQLQDAHFGNTGWAVSALNDPTASNNPTYHSRHTHLSFNLDYISPLQYNYYDARALACRELGRIAGVSIVPSADRAAHGSANDCMSFGGNPDTQVSKSENASNYTYTNAVGQHTKDLISAQYAAHEPLVSLLPGRFKTTYERGEPLTEGSDTFSVEAKDQSATGSDAGLTKLDVFEGTVVRGSTTSDCGTPGSCRLTLDVPIGEGYAEGNHTFRVVATDRLGMTVSRNYTFVVDRLGDIHHAAQYSGDPAAGGEPLIEEWARLASGVSRTEDESLTTTYRHMSCSSSHAINGRCVEMRQTLDLLSQGKTYTVYTGVSDDDPRIPGSALILDPRGFSQAPIAQGDIYSALASWQLPPPTHGSTYELYKFAHTEQLDPDPTDEQSSTTSVAVVDRIWVDVATRLPLKIVTTGPAGQNFGSSFFTYSERLETSQVPGSFFLLQPPTNAVLEKIVTLFGADPVGSQLDAETGAPFTPFYLGEQPTVSGDTYCLASSSRMSLEEEVDTTQPGDVAEDPENALDPAAAAAETSIDATYNRLDAGDPCVPGEGSLAGPPLQVISEAKGTPDAVSWRDTYQATAQAADADPNAPAGSGGVMTVTFDGGTRTAYAVPLPEPPPNADDGLSVLVTGDDTQVTVSGEFQESEIPAVLQLLEAQ